MIIIVIIIITTKHIDIILAKKDSFISQQLRVFTWFVRCDVAQSQAQFEIEYPRTQQMKKF